MYLRDCGDFVKNCVFIISRLEDFKVRMEFDMKININSLVRLGEQRDRPNVLF